MSTISTEIQSLLEKQQEVINALQKIQEQQQERIRQLEEQQETNKKLIQYLFDPEPICTAARDDDVAMLKHLIEIGLDIEKKNAEGSTALYLAAAKGHRECMQALLDAGANKEIKNKQGFTALHIVAIRGHIHCLQTLLNAGADKEVKNNQNLTAIYFAVLNGHADCVGALLAAGASFDMENPNNSTALQIAANRGHQDCVNAVLAVETNREQPTAVIDSISYPKNLKRSRSDHVEPSPSKRSKSKNPDKSTASPSNPQQSAKFFSSKKSSTVVKDKVSGLEITYADDAANAQAGLMRLANVMYPNSSTIKREPSSPTLEPLSRLKPPNPKA